MKNRWIKNLHVLRLYIIKYKNILSLQDSAVNIQHFTSWYKVQNNTTVLSLIRWISTQNINYHNNKMNNPERINLFEAFIEDYDNFFDNNIWKYNLQKVKDYIDTYHCLPNRFSNDKHVRGLDSWISKQKILYRRKLRMFKHNKYCDLWKDFIMKYDIKNNTDIWNDRLLDLQIFIDLFHKLPNRSSKDPNESKLSMWITTQKVKYKNKIMIMSDEIIRNRWDNFRSENKSLFNY